MSHSRRVSSKQAPWQWPAECTLTTLQLTGWKEWRWKHSKSSKDFHRNTSEGFGLVCKWKHSRRLLYGNKDLTRCMLASPRMDLQLPLQRVSRWLLAGPCRVHLACVERYFWSRTETVWHHGCQLCHLHLINQSIMYLEWSKLQVIKSLQDPLEVGNNLLGINANVRERGPEQKCF